MDKAPTGQYNSVPESRQQSSHDGGGRRPPYEFYEKGINEIERGWIAPILSFLRNRNSGEVVAIAVIAAIFGITIEFIRNKNDDPDNLTLAAPLITAAMIFIIGLLAMLRVTKVLDVEDTQEKQSQKTQFGISNERTNENGSSAGRDKRT
jgi:prolipoprotein diacylglyceryltransferase